MQTFVLAPGEVGLPYWSSNIIGEKLIPNFAAKFQCLYLISHVKLQNCHGNICCILISAMMTSRFIMVTYVEVMEIKEEAENSNAGKSTINWVRVFEKWCDQNSLEKKLEMILLEQLYKVLKQFYTSVCKQDRTNLSPMRLKGNQMVFLSPFDYT